MAEQSTNPSSESILIVDDSADNLRVLSTTLNKQGYEVRAAKSGSMALRGAQAALPDLILLDIRMPEMDGYEVCQRLKANPITCEVPIIFISALDEPLDKLKAFTIGGADYITKPFQVEEVVARVENQLTIRRLKKQLTAYMALPTENGFSHQQESELPVSDMHPALLSRITQELLTPINHILEQSQLLSHEPHLSPAQRRKLDLIRQKGSNLLELVHDFLSP